MEQWQIDALRELPADYTPPSPPTTRKDADVVLKAALMAMAKRGDPKPKGAMLVALNRYSYRERAATRYLDGHSPAYGQPEPVFCTLWPRSSEKQNKSKR